MSYMLLKIVGILGAVILGVVLVWLIRAVKAQEERSQQPHWMRRCPKSREGSGRLAPVMAWRET